jgi:hypothetical protein
MIDFADAHARVIALMAKYGQETVPVCLKLEVWDHRTGKGPEISFTFSAGGGSQMAYMQPTIDAAITELDRLLGKRYAAVPPLAPSELSEVVTP